MSQDNYFSKLELESLLHGKIQPEVISKIIAAYEMTENAQSDIVDQNGFPKFFHTTRLARILIYELDIYDPELIISALLHNLLLNCNEISISLIDYNFGSEVAYNVQLLTDNYMIISGQKDDNLNLEYVDDDTMILILIDCLDVVRSLDFLAFLNPFAYLEDIRNRYYAVAKKRDNEKIHYLLKELKKSFNKLIG